MEEENRQIILKNTKKLIRLTKYDELMTKCVESNLLTTIMRQNIERSEICEEQRSEDQWHEKLFYKITKRGPNAFQDLKDVLAELKMDEALRVLNCDDDFQSIKTNKPLISKKINKVSELQDAKKIEMYSKDNNLNDDNNKENDDKIIYEVVKSTSIKVDTKVGTYPMRSKNNRGVFFMVNIIDFLNGKDKRNGAEKDGRALIHLFSELGFKPCAYENLTKEEFIKNLDEILRSQDVRDTECFVMALMTHGNLDSNKTECVEFHDGDIMKVPDILHKFTHYNCPNLVDKPKVFIFPFCRGDDTEYSSYRPTQTDSIARISHNGIHDTIPYISDVLLFYASMRGFKAHRDVDNGNWYIQKFCEIMSKHAHDTDLERIVKMVQGEVGKLRTNNGAMQTCCSENISFNRCLFFNPGASEP